MSILSKSFFAVYTKFCDAVCANAVQETRLEKLLRWWRLLSSLLVSLIGVLQYVTGSADSLWQDTTMFSDISGRVVSTFANPNVLAEYLILMLPFAGAMLITSENKTERAFYPLTFACHLSDIYMVARCMAWLYGFCNTVCANMVEKIYGRGNVRTACFSCTSVYFA